MIFTTGTTSEPKCAVHTVKSISAIIQNTINGAEMSYDDVVLNPLPLNHFAGLRVLRAALFIGATVVLQAVLLSQKLLKIISQNTPAHDLYVFQLLLNF